MTHSRCSGNDGYVDIRVWIHDYRSLIPIEFIFNFRNKSGLAKFYQITGKNLMDACMTVMYNIFGYLIVFDTSDYHIRSNFLKKCH